MRTEDSSIIQECLNGETEAFGMLVDKYKEGIYAFAYGKLRDFQDAQDVTQEVFIEAYRSLRTLKRWESFSFWLYRIAFTKCGLWLRNKAKKVDRDFIEDQGANVIDNPSINSYQQSQLIESVRESLDLLPEAYREVLVLYYFGGMNSDEIAEATGKSPNAVRMSLSRARERLREEMIGTMNTAFEGQRLRVGFTFKVVEAIKRVKIDPTPSIRGLPWGLSIATGLMLIIFGIGQNINISEPMEIFTAFQLSGEAKVSEIGEFPVDITDIAKIPSLSSLSGNGHGIGSSIPSLQNALFMAPQAEEGTWTKKADMPTARCALSICDVKGKIYAIGGYSNQFLSTVEEYDPKTNTWLKKADMPTARGYFGISVVNDKIYIIGGSAGAGNFFSIVEEYDPEKDIWTRKADMPTNRYDLSTIALDGKIYAIGGSSDGINMLSAVEEYDPEKDKWTKKDNMPIVREAASASVVDGKIYLTGGSSINGPQRRIDEYDPAKDKWTWKGNMSGLRRHLSSSVINGKIYIIGGIFLNNPLSTVEEYDPIANKLTTKANMPTARGYLSACAVKDKIYVIGGSTDAGILATVEEYNLGMPDQSIDFKGKLPTTWGETKTVLNK